MKKVFCLLLSVLVILSMVGIASAEESEFLVEDIATYFLNDALSQPAYFSLPNLNGKSIYLCDPINPYVLVGNQLYVYDDVECYLIKTDDEIIASVVLCYDGDVLLSACLDIGLAVTISTNCDIDEAFQLVGHDNILYVKTADDVGTSNTQAFTRTANTDTVTCAIANADSDLSKLSVKSQLTDIITNPITSRSSKILNVPYVAQVSNTCWAAAGAAFGQYYTGSTYAHYTAQFLSEDMGISIATGAGMGTTQAMLSKYFNLSTTYYGGRLSDSVAINMFQQGKPIIAGFTGTGLGHMVVLCGYDDHATGIDITFYVRDSNYSYLRSVISYSNTGSLAMYYYGDVKTWGESLY